MSGVAYVDGNGSRARPFDEAKGYPGIADAIRFIGDFHGSHGDRVRGCLLPDRIETQTPEVLRRTARASAELDVPVRLHCCQTQNEVGTVQSLHGMTPYRWLDLLGLMNTRAILPHGIYTSGDDDLNCSTVPAHRPSTALLFSRAVARRCDIGRLATIARADITVFDLPGFHLGQFIDPIKTLVLSGRGSDFRASFIDGKEVMTDFHVRGADYGALQRLADAQFQKAKAAHVRQAGLRGGPQQLFKPSFPVLRPTE